MKICDFGLSLSGASSQTTGGTVAYMPPEMLALQFGDDETIMGDATNNTAFTNSREITTQASSANKYSVDVFAMGIIVWEVRDHVIILVEAGTNNVLIHHNRSSLRQSFMSISLTQQRFRSMLEEASGTRTKMLSYFRQKLIVTADVSLQRFGNLYQAQRRGDICEGEDGVTTTISG